MKYLLILKKSVETPKIPFALSLSKGERGFGSRPRGERAVSRSCFDRLSTNGSRHTATDFFRLIGLLLFSTLFFITGCSISPKQPALHDFGLPASILAYKAKRDNKPAITVDAPTWLWDDRIRYRLLYSSPTRVGFYALDLWIAPPPELFEQLLISSGKIQNYSLIIRLQDFEQQFVAPDRARVVLRFSVEAYSDGNNKKVGTQEFYLEQPTATPNAAGAVNGFAHLTRQAADRIQVWLAGLSDKG